MSIDSNDRSDSIRTRRANSQTHCLEHSRRVGASREDRSAPPAPARDTTVDLNESAPRVGPNDGYVSGVFDAQARSPQFRLRIHMISMMRISISHLWGRCTASMTLATTRAASRGRRATARDPARRRGGPRRGGGAAGRATARARVDNPRPRGYAAYRPAPINSTQRPAAPARGAVPAAVRGVRTTFDGRYGTAAQISRLSQPEPVNR